MRVMIKTREIIKSVGGFRQHEENEYILDYKCVGVQRSGDISIRIEGKREKHLALSEVVDMRFYC